MRHFKVIVRLNAALQLKKIKICCYHCKVRVKYKEPLELPHKEDIKSEIISIFVI